MKSWLVILVNASRARLLSLDWPDEPEIDGGPRLQEIGDLVNPEARVHDRERYSEAKGGRNRATYGGPAHAYDDHRNAHDEEAARSFARRIAQALDERVEAFRPHRVILVAPPKAMGALRPTLSAKVKDALVERTEDLSALSLPQLQEALIERDLVPTAARTTGGFRPSGQAPID